MDTESLWVFAKVAELRSLTRAAEHLGTTKSNVSRRLKSLVNGEQWAETSTAGMRYSFEEMLAWAS